MMKKSYRLVWLAVDRRRDGGERLRITSTVELAVESGVNVLAVLSVPTAHDYHHNYSY